MMVFVATSLRNEAEAVRITEMLDGLGIRHLCCITESGNLTGKELFDHYVEGISQSDVVVVIQKNIGRDTSVEIGIAYALGKKLLLVVYDDASATLADSMVYWAARDRVTEKGLAERIQALKGDCEQSPLTQLHQPGLRQHRTGFVRDLDRVFASERYVNSYHVQALEHKLASRYQRPVVAVANGTSGLTASLMAISNGNGGEVVVPALTFAATIQAIIAAGCTPVFAEVLAGSWTLDPDDAASRVTPRTKALLPVSLFGVPCDIQGLHNVASTHGVTLVYDSCQAFGSLSPKGELGRFGDAEVFSLDATKILSGGLGGFIAVKDDSLESKVRAAANVGLNNSRQVVIRGINARLSEFNAALALRGLPAEGGLTAKRRSLEAMYEEALEQCKAVQFQEVPEGCIPARHQFAVAVGANRDRTLGDIQAQLGAEGIEVRPFLLESLHKNPAAGGSQSLSLPITERLVRELLCVPIHEGVDHGLITRAAKVITRGTE